MNCDIILKIEFDFALQPPWSLAVAIQTLVSNEREVEEKSEILCLVQLFHFRGDVFRTSPSRLFRR
jgi:hypothetical protein